MLHCHSEWKFIQLSWTRIQECVKLLDSSVVSLPLNDILKPRILPCTVLRYKLAWWKSYVSYCHSERSEESYVSYCHSERSEESRNAWSHWILRRRFTPPLNDILTHKPFLYTHLIIIFIFQKSSQNLILFKCQKITVPCQKHFTLKITLSLAFVNKNRNLISGVWKTFYIFCEIMETGELAQAAINLIEWNENVWDMIENTFSSGEWFFQSIFQSDIRLWSAIIIFLIWISALVWVIKDANARSSSFWFQLLSVIIVLLFTPVFGILLYIAIRPQWYKWDKTARRDTLFQDSQICENCWEFNHIDNLYCTSCGESLHTTCRECESKYSKNYAYCPNCGAPRLED